MVRLMVLAALLLALVTAEAEAGCRSRGLFRSRGGSCGQQAQRSTQSGSGCAFGCR